MIKYFIFILIINVAFSQTPSQIKQAKSFIKTNNLTKQQAIDLAKKKGFNNSEINNAINQENQKKQDYNQNLNNSGNADIKNKVPAEEIKVNFKEKTVNELPIIDSEDLEVIDENTLDIESVENNIVNKRNYYFGYDIFKRDPSIFQASEVGAVDPDYIIGPGDDIIVMLWGETQFRQVLTVDREGFIFIPEVGQAFVNGLNLSLLESKLFRVFSQSYASLNPEGRKPTTFLDVSIGKLRPLRIQVLGEVGQPGAYTVNPSSTLFSSLYYFKGPSFSGSLRDIRLIRGGEQITSIDFYDFLLTGKKPKDQKLQLDDVVFIPQRLKTVTIQGAINRAGIYELKENETFRDLIQIAGGLSITAYLDRAQVDRIVPFSDREELKMDRMLSDVNLEAIINENETFSLKDGDKIEIFSVLDIRQNVVNLSGAVTRPGAYDIGEKLSLRDLIQKADGLLGDAYLDRVDIVRIKSDFTEQLIKLDLEKALNEDSINNINLQSLDQVRVYGMSEMVPKTYVSISGHVKKPGKYSLQENMTLYDLIFKSGGFVDDEFKKRTYLKRAELVRVQESDDEKEIISFNLGLVIKKDGLFSTLLRADDAVRVYGLNEIEGENRYVSIDGQVKRPGKYELFENTTLYDLIFISGGFDDAQFKNTTYLKRADLIRKSEDGKKEIIPFNLESVINKKGLFNIRLMPDDEVKIYNLNDVMGQTRYVTINGHVKKPGQYELYENNMLLSDLLFKAGGYEDSTFFKDTYLERADLIRKNKNSFESTLIQFDLGKILNDVNHKDNLKLFPGDEVRVYSLSIFNNTKYVTLNGAVKNPGKYLLKSNNNIKDLILEAGGFSDDIYRFIIDIIRVDPYSGEEKSYAKQYRLEMLGDFSFKISKSDNNNKTDDRLDKFLLSPYDRIDIRPDPYFKLQKIVKINGAVYYPGEYALLNPNEKLSDIIKRSGGILPNAFTQGSRFTRNGQTVQLDLEKILKKPKSKNNIIVLEGDEIFIANKPGIISIEGEVNSPGLYTYQNKMRVKDYLKYSGGLNNQADKDQIFIKYASGKSKKYSSILNNHKVSDGSRIIVSPKEEEEPFDKTEFAKELAAILASFAQVVSILIISRG
tara:strand:+ start:13373 stop:16681 length:3309 start_codon:yes stop_codon:yes gene_type:complete